MPWRFPPGKADPYRVWISEVMLQQTRVETVVPYYRRFVEAWPTLSALAAAREEEVLAAWSGLGYYARCRHLLAAARQAQARHGRLPGSLELLRELPGFGLYTAGAVASIAFGIVAPAVDGNASRVLSRVFHLSQAGRDSPARTHLGELAAALADCDRPGDLNQSLMELGATLCRPRGPLCRRCPVGRSCEARRSGRPAALPGPRRRPAQRLLELALARIERDGRLLLERRPGRGLFGGLWQLPGVEIARGWGTRALLRGDLGARLGVRCRLGDELAVVERALTHRRLVLRVFRGEVWGDPCAPARPELRWQGLAHLDGVAISTAMRRAIEASEGWGPAGPAGLAGRGGRPGDPRRRGRRKALTSRGPTV